jgi:hypothetical protein
LVSWPRCISSAADICCSYKQQQCDTSVIIFERIFITDTKSFVSFYIREEGSLKKRGRDDVNISVLSAVQHRDGRIASSVYGYLSLQIKHIPIMIVISSLGIFVAYLIMPDAAEISRIGTERVVFSAMCIVRSLVPRKELLVLLRRGGNGGVWDRDVCILPREIVVR